MEVLEGVDMDEQVTGDLALTRRCALIKRVLGGLVIVGGGIVEA